MLKSSKTKEGHSAFTQHDDYKIREIITDCSISLPYHPKVNVGETPPPVVKAKALWDTGATNSVITKKLIDALGLKHFREVDVNHAGGVSKSFLFKVNILLPNNVVMPYVNVTECVSAAGNFDLIIGMDIITQGDFAITNLDGKTTVSYRYPSNVRIDFNDGETKIISPERSTPNRDTDKINYTGTPKGAPCPCGSGKKYKRCHGIGL